MEVKFDHALRSKFFKNLLISVQMLIFVVTKIPLK